jgi:protein TonB
MAMAAAAAAGAVSAPPSVTRAPEKIRAGEFLQSQTSAPSAQFDTESEGKPSQEPPIPEVNALTDLEPTAASVDASASPQSQPKETLTGWAMLQARLTTSEPRAAAPARARAKNELLSYGETRSYSGPSAAPRTTEESRSLPKKELPQNADAESEASLFAYISGKSAKNSDPIASPRPKLGKILTIAASAAVCVGLAAAPRTRQSLQTFYRNSVRTGNRLLNPSPAPLPQAETLHDSFGQSGDEYKLPLPGNIPDATTDPSQIRVLPVVDPTAKPQKNPDANTGQEQAPFVENTPAEQNQPAPNQAAQQRITENDVKDAPPASGEGVPGNLTDARPGAPPSQTELMPSTPAVHPAVQPAVRQHPVTSPAPRPVAPHTISAGVRAGLPSSLKSQLASSTPQISGSKPIEAAMSSIEPVNLPEPVVRVYLIQPVNPAYPPAARATGQRGSVVLQVLIGHDGAVQDVKFLQGSLVFARAAIDAVKQWRFKPYSLNGRVVTVQSVITLNFKPPA